MAEQDPVHIGDFRFQSLGWNPESHTPGTCSSHVPSITRYFKDASTSTQDKSYPPLSLHQMHTWTGIFWYETDTATEPWGNPTLRYLLTAVPKGDGRPALHRGGASPCIWSQGGSGIAVRPLSSSRQTSRWNQASNHRPKDTRMTFLIPEDRQRPLAK